MLPRSFVAASGLADGSRRPRGSVRPAADRGRHALAPPPRARSGAALAARDGRGSRQGPGHRRAARPACRRRAARRSPTRPERAPRAARENRPRSAEESPWPGSRDSRAACIRSATSSCSRAPAAIDRSRRCCCCTAIRRRTRCGIASRARWPPTSRSSSPTCAATATRPSRRRRRRPSSITRSTASGRWPPTWSALMRSLGHERFAVVGHDRGGRVAHRLALDHPERVERLAVIDIVPTLDMYEATDMRFASWYYHWFFLIQPAPLPERMIGGDPALLSALDARRAGAPRPRRTSSPRRWPSTSAASAAPTRSTPPARTTAPRRRSTSSTTAPRAPPARRSPATCSCCGATRGVVGRLYDPLALWRAQCAATVEGSAMEAGHFIPEELPDETARAAARLPPRRLGRAFDAFHEARARGPGLPSRHARGRSAHVRVDQPARPLLSDPLRRLGAVHRRLRRQRGRLVRRWA